MPKKTLVIVESPAKAKTINRFLGKNYRVTSSMGHVIDLPKSKMGVDVENGFAPQYITIRGKGELLKKIKAEAKKSDRILLATDPDREGEAIAWHLQQALGTGDGEPARVEFHEITRDAVKKALLNPRELDIQRVEAQQARRLLDRLVGYSLSPLLWKKVKKGLSAGRVQSVAVRIIIDREEEIDSFQPEEYWTLDAFLRPKTQDPGGGTGVLEAGLARIGGRKARIASREEMDAVLEKARSAPYTVSRVTRRDREKRPYAPYTTSSLQQDAARKLNFTAKKTMRVAQQLYEGIDLGKQEGGSVGLITYIRTDSMRISQQAQEEALAYIKEQYGPEYRPPKNRFYGKKKNAQDAHEAIRPSSVLRTPAGVSARLSRDQARLYKMIWERFVASQMASAVLDARTIEIEADPGGDTMLFRATGSVLQFPGFLAVDQDSKRTLVQKQLPDLAEGAKLQLEKLADNQHFTQPPPRYNEASLVKTLEELGIGRPSTYAPTIDTILNRGYVIKEDKQFYSTELGRIVVDLLSSHFSSIVDTRFTAEMEARLDSVEEGTTGWQELLSEFYGGFSQELQKAEQEISKVEIEPEVSDVVCEKCGRQMVVKMGRYGKFLACPGFPECRSTKPIIQETGRDCPKCGDKIIEKKSRAGRTFYGCQAYPDCDFVSWDLPLDEKCPQCGFPLARKTKRFGGYRYCLDSTCGYREASPARKKSQKKKTDEKKSDA